LAGDDWNRVNARWVSPFLKQSLFQNPAAQKSFLAAKRNVIADPDTFTGAGKAINRLRLVSPLWLHHSIYQFREPATKLNIQDNFDVRILTHSRVKLVSQ
jgi:hypothetical protein